MAKRISKSENSHLEAGAKRFGQSANSYRRTRDDHSTELAEDYVELIDSLITEQGEARLVEIARRMGVTHVTANRTIARLQREGLVTKEPYRSIFLTTSGKRLARKCRERHETVYAFLRAIGVPKRDAHLDSEGIEHHIGQATLHAMSRFLEDRK